jgi:hypothetical protein
MRLSVCRDSAIRRTFGPQETLPLAALLSFLLVGLYQFLQTAPAQFGASPLFQVLRWLSDGLMAMPLFAAAVWTGHWAASRLGLTLASRTDVFRRALLIAGALAVFLTPGWFAYNELARLTQSADLVFGHSHGAGGGITKYWVSSVVIYVLLLVPLSTATIWTAYQVINRYRFRLSKIADLFARGSVIAILLGGIPVLAWFLHEAANRAVSAQVYYTTAQQFAHIHSHAFFAADHGAHLPPPGPPVTAAPFALAYQVARAFQDGLVGQAIGLPVVALVLLWGTSQLLHQDQHQEESSHLREVAER